MSKHQNIYKHYGSNSGNNNSENGATAKVERINREAKGGGSVGVIVALIIGLVVGFGFGSYWYNIRPEANLASPTDNGAMDKNGDVGGNVMKDKEADKSMVGGEAMIDGKKDQSMEATFGTSLKVNTQIAGPKVIVENVAVDSTTWVAVREDVDGALGNVLGAKRIEAGIYSNIEVELLRSTEGVSTYHVVLFKDDGDKIFNHKNDLPLTEDGELIVGTFTTL